MEPRQPNLRECQRVELEILLELRRVCDQLGLQYFLTAGTLLGAVRHGGFIPWDDDIDVAMPRGDYERFVREGHSFLTSGYLFQEYRTQPLFPYYFSKIRKLGTRVDEPILRAVPMEQGIYIDIFPLDICPDRENCAKMLFKCVELLDCALLSRVSAEFVCNYQKKSARLAWGLLRRLPNRMLFQLREWLRGALAFGASGKKLCTIGGHHGYPRETYETTWFQKTAEVYFETYAFPAPSGWHELLRNMYGDYMTLPPEEERQGHFETAEERNQS